MTVRSYDGQVQPFIDLALDRLDAVVMDTPIALYYATGPHVKNIEIPAARIQDAVLHILQTKQRLGLLGARG